MAGRRRKRPTCSNISNSMASPTSSDPSGHDGEGNKTATPHKKPKLDVNDDSQCPVITACPRRRRGRPPLPPKVVLPIDQSPRNSADGRNDESQCPVITACPRRRRMRPLHSPKVVDQNRPIDQYPHNSGNESNICNDVDFHQGTSFTAGLEISRAPNDISNSDRNLSNDVSSLNTDTRPTSLGDVLHNLTATETPTLELSKIELPELLQHTAKTKDVVHNSAKLIRYCRLCRNHNKLVPVHHFIQQCVEFYECPCLNCATHLRSHYKKKIQNLRKKVENLKNTDNRISDEDANIAFLHFQENLNNVMMRIAMRQMEKEATSSNHPITDDNDIQEIFPSSQTGGGSDDDDVILDLDSDFRFTFQFLKIVKSEVPSMHKQSGCVEKTGGTCVKLENSPSIANNQGSNLAVKREPITDFDENGNDTYDSRSDQVGADYLKKQVKARPEDSESLLNNACSDSSASGCAINENLDKLIRHVLDNPRPHLKLMAKLLNGSQSEK